MDVESWKMCFSKSRATAHAQGLYHEQNRWRDRAAYWRGGVKALVPYCGLLAALPRSLLLADRADDPVGFHPDIPDDALGCFRAGRRHSLRRGDVMGCFVPRPD